MGDEFKRLFVIAGAILIGGASLLLLPLMKLRIAPRPAAVPSTALYAAGRGQNYWIDCPNVASPTRYYCTVYSRDGSAKVLRGVFQETAGVGPLRIAYYGSVIYWKRGTILRPVHLDCVAGGRPPDVPDCGSATR